MALGFDGTIGESQWAQIASRVGSPLPVVLGRGDLAVSINSAATRTVNVAAGSYMANGLMDTLTAGSVVLDNVTTSGQTRWDAVVLRADWSANTVTLTKVNGVAAVSAAAVLPGGLLSTPGVSFDHVLALVQITYGQSLPTAVQDKRGFAVKSHLYTSVTALPPPTAGLYGARVELLDGTRYRCLVDNSSAPAWVMDSGNIRILTQSQMITTAANFTAGSLSNRAVIIDNVGVQLDLMVRRLSSQIAANTVSGNFPDTPIATLGVDCQPDQPLMVPVLYSGGASSAQVAGMSTISAGGAWVLKSGMPGQDLMPSSVTGDYSIRASFFFGRQGS